MDTRCKLENGFMAHDSEGETDCDKSSESDCSITDDLDDPSSPSSSSEDENWIKKDMHLFTTIHSPRRTEPKNDPELSLLFVVAVLYILIAAPWFYVHWDNLPSKSPTKATESTASEIHGRNSEVAVWHNWNFLVGVVKGWTSTFWDLIIGSLNIASSYISQSANYIVESVKFASSEEESSTQSTERTLAAKISELRNLVKKMKFEKRMESCIINQLDQCMVSYTTPTLQLNDEECEEEDSCVHQCLVKYTISRRIGCYASFMLQLLNPMKIFENFNNS